MQSPILPSINKLLEVMLGTCAETLGHSSKKCRYCINRIIFQAYIVILLKMKLIKPIAFSFREVFGCAFAAPLNQAPDTKDIPTHVHVCVCGGDP